jgi:hypothetical protein
MAQHDYVIDNGSGQAVRLDINGALEAILTNNSGGSEPTSNTDTIDTPIAYMFWADTSASPQVLKIRDSSNGSWIKICEILSGGIGTIANGQFYIGDGTINAPGLAFKGDTDTGLRRSSDGDFSIVVGGDRKLSIDTAGNVGIGNNAPAAELHIEDDSANCVLQVTSGTTSSSIIRLGDTSDASSGKIQYDNTTDNAADQLKFDVAGSTRLKILHDGKVGIAEATPTEVLHVNGNIKSTSIIFIGDDTDNPHEENGTTEKTRIQQDEISVAANGSAGLKINRLGSDGNVARFFRSGTQVGTISVTGSATAYNESSDHRLKENIVDMVDGITRVKQLQPRRFNFITDAETTVDGFVAHEAQAVVPEAVTGTHNGVDENGDPVMQGIDKSKFVPLLTAALQEAIAKIETLEAKVAALETAS